MGEQVKVGDLVWAKMKGFSPWPGKVTIPAKNMKRPKSNKSKIHCIFFFGSDNFAWIEEDKIKSYEEHKDQLENACKTILFKEACLAIAEYKKKKDAGEIINAFEGSIGGHLRQAPPPSLTVQLITKNKRKNVPSKLEKGELTGTDNRAVSAKKFRESTEPKPAIPRAHKQPAPQKLLNIVTPYHQSAGASLVDPSTLSPPDAVPLDVLTITQTLKDKNIQPSDLKFGFLGLETMGAGMVKNLLNSGHEVLVWNPIPEKCKQFVGAGAVLGMAPSDVISGADVTFSCVADPIASKDVFYGNCGVLLNMDATKGFVEMTTIDSETSQDIAEAIALKGGRYLEAQVQGSKSDAEEGTLVILAAGDPSLYEDCQSTFQAMGKNSFFLGNVGNATKMNLVLQLMMRSSLAIFAEGMALADRVGFQRRDVLEILELTHLNCSLFRSKSSKSSSAIIDGGSATQKSVQHSMQNDLKLALKMGDEVEQTLPMAATAIEVYKNAERLRKCSPDLISQFLLNFSDF